MESWRKCWRDGVLPSLSKKGLLALERALECDDPRLLQGATTSPPPLQCVQEWPLEGADPIAFCGWQGEGCKTVGEAEEYFARVCFEADQRIGEPAACRWWLNFWDDAPRAEAIRAMLPEVKRALALRSKTPTAA